MLNRLSIRYKIGLIALIGLLGFVVFQTASYRLSISLRDQMQSMIVEDFALLQFPNEVQANFSELDKLYQAALAESDMDTLLEADAKAAEMQSRFQAIKTLYRLNDRHYINLMSSFDAYIARASSHSAAVITETLDYDSTLSGYEEMNLLRDNYRKTEKGFIAERYKMFEEELRSIERQQAFFVMFGLALGVVLSVILIAFSLFITRRLINAFSNAVMVAEQIAKGNLDQRIETVAQDETGHLITSLTVMRDVLKSQKEEDLHREQMQNFLAGLNEVMRGDKSLEELSSLVLDYLINELHSYRGVVYWFEENHLKCMAANPLSLTDSVKTILQLDEGSIGLAAKGQRVQIINDTSLLNNPLGNGSTDLIQESILLFPLVFEGHLKAIFVMGSKKCFIEEDLLLIQRCNDAVAIAFNSAQSRFKVASMLHQTQQQADELKRQRQELALFNRQLEEKTFYLDSQRNEILEKNRELELSGHELIEKSKALELSGRYKSQFLSTMSHELRTPLNSILILSDALMENRNAHLDERELQHVQVINNAGADLLSLINDILDLSKVEEGKMEIVIDEIATDELVGNFTEQFYYIAKEKGLEFVVTVAPDAPPVFYTDRHRLKQIIKNFISNALKFTEMGGVYLDILPPDAEFKKQYGDRINENSLLFRVRDTGVGIEKNKQAMVFEAFKQADGTTSRKYGGTGLGLSISLALAKLLGGDIVLQSEGEGKGSSFTLIVQTASAESCIADAEKKDISSLLENQQYGHSANSLKLAGFRVSDEFLLLIADKDIAEAIIQAAARYSVDCQWEKSWELLEKLLEKQNYSIAFVVFSLLGEDPLKKISYLRERVDNLYVVAPANQQDAITHAGCHFVPDFKEKEDISALILQVIEFQQTHSSKVLVIEDNPVFQQVLRTVFTSHQLNVTIASDGKQALEYMQMTAFDCLIVDLNLPDYQNTELLQKIRANVLYQTQPIIVFTAEDLSVERQKDIKRYASQILLKTPNIIVSLYENVKQLIHQQKHSALIFGSDVSVQGRYSAEILRGKCLLLVDDDARNIYSMSAMLESEGIKILSAKSGKEALVILKNNLQIDMVLLDIMMPEMDGYEVLRIMRQDTVLKDLPVITVTAKAMMGDKEKCLAAGATDYLSKPVNKQILLSHIFAILGRQNA
jgi:signal transduction histidine kinase/CheY-like chemotaxis protein/HAMP domain-containing protein